VKRPLINRKAIRNILLRLLILAGGSAITVSVIYAAGRWLVPITDSADKAILAAVNPDTYMPGLDEFMRAETDYTNFIIGATLLSWGAAYLLYRLLPKFKNVFTALLVIETVVLVGFAITGKLFWNKELMGANVLFVIFILLFFGLTAYLYHKWDHDALRRFGRLFLLILLSIYITNTATNHIKDTVKRPRPFNDANKPWNERVRVIPEEILRGANSFPSGHTSGTFALLTPIFWYTRDRRVRAVLLFWCILQGFTRVYTAAHFPFCVTMGGILGFTIGTLVFFTLGGPNLRKPIEPEPK